MSYDVLRRALTFSTWLVKVDSYRTKDVLFSALDARYDVMCLWLFVDFSIDAVVDGSTSTNEDFLVFCTLMCPAYSGVGVL